MSEVGRFRKVCLLLIYCANSACSRGPRIPHRESLELWLQIRIVGAEIGRTVPILCGSESSLVLDVLDAVWLAVLVGGTGFDTIKDSRNWVMLDSEGSMLSTTEKEGNNKA